QQPERADVQIAMPRSTVETLTASIQTSAGREMMQFNNTSSANFGSFGNRVFVWDYGDGSPPDTANFNPPRRHTYAAPGTYFVTLTVIDTTFCNTPVSDTQRVSLNPTVKAIFSTPAIGCAPYSATFTNLSLAGTDWLWEFGDGETSTDFEPVHLYQNPGTYRVRLIAYDTSTCNRVDTSAYFTITVYEKPTAVISSWGPNPPQENTPVTFGNGSLNAVRYEWNFGDGEISDAVAPSHQYITTGSFDVQLVAFNAAGCTDTTYERVQVIIVPLLDVPNAFTPGKFGENAVVTVKGFGIAKMDWKIYNRFGQMVFSSTSPKFGWDGTFKGKLQPMDVYAYTLDVQFSDGQKLRKTGDISLLR
ncbi:MAG: PKD domain-containing protein, partial [Sphingobacteriales bacterium]